jgi:type I restriction enzyme M protein
MPFEAFADCLAWWGNRKETDRAWKVPAAELLAAGCNLDRKNPSAKPDAEHLPPGQLVESILAKEAKIAAIVGEIKALLDGQEGCKVTGCCG